jgi:hypothetical protein
MISSTTRGRFGDDFLFLLSARERFDFDFILMRFDSNVVHSFGHGANTSSNPNTRGTKNASTRRIAALSP